MDTVALAQVVQPEPLTMTRARQWVRASESGQRCEGTGAVAAGVGVLAPALRPERSVLLSFPRALVVMLVWLLPLCPPGIYCYSTAAAAAVSAPTSDVYRARIAGRHALLARAAMASSILRVRRYSGASRHCLLQGLPVGEMSPELRRQVLLHLTRLRECRQAPSCTSVARTGARRPGAPRRVLCAPSRDNRGRASQRACGDGRPRRGRRVGRSVLTCCGGAGLEQAALHLVSPREGRVGHPRTRLYLVLIGAAGWGSNCVGLALGRSEVVMPIFASPTILTCRQVWSR